LDDKPKSINFTEKISFGFKKITFSNKLTSFNISMNNIK